MDPNLIIFIFFMIIILSGMTYLEWLYKTRKSEEGSKARTERLNNYIVKERNKRNKEKQATIDYLMKISLEYDPSTHTYIKIERLRSNEVEIIKPK